MVLFAMSDYYYFLKKKPGYQTTLAVGSLNPLNICAQMFEAWWFGPVEAAYFFLNPDGELNPNMCLWLSFHMYD